MLNGLDLLELAWLNPRSFLYKKDGTMRTPRLFCASLAFAASGYASVAFAAPFTYELQAYPADAAACHAAARTLGERLAAMPGVSVTRAICASANAVGAKLVFSYEAEAALPLVTTYDRYGTLDGAGGLYATRAECDAALEAETAHFQTATQLEPFVSYCYEDVFADELPYGHRIDAFGAPVKAPLVESTRLFGELVGVEPEDVAASVREGVEASGADVRFVKLEPAAGDSTIGIGYYATPETKIRVEGERIAFVETEAQCNQALALTSTAFGSVRGASTLASVCTSDWVMNYYTVYVVTLGMPALYNTASVERFRSYDACEAARPGLIRTYRDEYGRPVVGATCSRDAVSGGDNPWSVMLLEPR